MGVLCGISHRGLEMEVGCSVWYITLRPREGSWVFCVVYQTEA